MFGRGDGRGGCRSLVRVDRVQGTLHTRNRVMVGCQKAHLVVIVVETRPAMAAADNEPGVLRKGTIPHNVIPLWKRVAEEGWAILQPRWIGVIYIGAARVLTPCRSMG